jgi:capsular polysaccharide transport system ATP-binding protein
MIRLDNLKYTYFRGRTVFDGITVDMPSHRRMALLGGPDSGKTTLIGLLSGVIDPTEGKIVRRARLSYPAGYNRAFRTSNSVRQNVMFAAQIYDADPAEVVDFIAGILDLHAELDRPMRDLPIPLRMTLAFALTYALPFDTYLFDNVIGPGDVATRDLWRQLFEARAATSGMIFATRLPRMAEMYCDCALVLRPAGNPVFCDDLRDGLALFEADTLAAGAARAAPATGDMAADTLTAQDAPDVSAAIKAGE